MFGQSIWKHGRENILHKLNQKYFSRIGKPKLLMFPSKEEQEKEKRPFETVFTTHFFFPIWKFCKIQLQFINSMSCFPVNFKKCRNNYPALFWNSQSENQHGAKGLYTPTPKAFMLCNPTIRSPCPHSPPPPHWALVTGKQFPCSVKCHPHL